MKTIAAAALAALKSYGNAYESSRSDEGSLVAALNEAAASLTTRKLNATPLPVNKIFVTSRSPTSDGIYEYQSTDGSGVVQVTQYDLPGTGQSGSTFHPTTSLDFVDMDGDGDLDLIRGGQDGAVWIHINDGSDNFPANDMITLPSTGGAWYYSIHGVDVDNDGDIDIVGTSPGHGAWIWMNNGGNTFAAGTQFSTTASSGFISAAADFNGDGFIDFIVSVEFGKPQVVINNGSGGFLSSYDLDDTSGSRSVSACDFNQDGHMDVVIGYRRNQNNRVFLNRGQNTNTPAFTEVILPHDNGDSISRGNGCADLNGDGYPDIVIADQTRSQVYLNEGAANPGSFPTKADLYTSDIQSLAIALGDLDGDGDIDVYSAHDQDRYIFLNNGDGTFGSGQNIYDDNAQGSGAAAFMYTWGAASAPASESPTGSPSSNPTASPSKTPTSSPSKAPTGSPQTDSPTNTPTASPSKTPTGSPSKAPTGSPQTDSPTNTPTASPTKAPTGSAQTASPTNTPTASPSNTLTGSPTKAPTGSPTPALAPGLPTPASTSAASSPTGCQPVYSAGASYAAGEQVSATTVIETPTTNSCRCSDASCPSNPGQATGCTKTTTVTTYETYNYQCVDSSDPNWVHCSNVGYKPTGIYGGLVWVKGAQCSGTATPADPLAGIANPPGCPEDFIAGTEYEPDAKVSTSIAGYSGPAKQIYICAADPMSKFCGQEHYEPGTGQHWNLVWTKDTVCFGSVSPTLSPSWDAARMIDGCPGAWAKGTNIYKSGDRVSKSGIVFECNSGEWSPHCSSEGYEPDVNSDTEHWRMVWTIVGRCTGTITPTGSPTFDQATVMGCPEDWAKGTTYEEGDLAAVTVSSTPLRKIAYRCKTWPFSGHCSMYSPADFGGDLGWTKEGGCTGTISPTAAPSFDALALVGGCPEKYSTAAEYKAGDRVAFQVAAGTAGSTALDDGWRFIVYECKGWPSTSHCSQDSYKPGSHYDYMAWTVKGHCDGTLSPTAAPTVYVNADCPSSAYSECTYEAGLPIPATTIPQCKYNKDVEVTGVACNCGDSGCPTPSPTSTSCTKTEIRNSCPAVDNWSSGVSYEEGDVVRVANNMYTCKEWPYYFNCGNAAYKPTADPGGLWKLSWTESGTCPSSC